MSGIPTTIWTITLLVLLGVLVVLGARYARHSGRLQSRSGKLIAVTVIALLAIAIWVGPAMFLASDGVAG
jgi:hypothetical protein